MEEIRLSNATPIRKVLFQTLVVRLRGENKMKYIRVLIDSGSSKSYLTNFAIKEMRYECIAEENLTHSLFGDDVNDLTPLTPSMFLHDLKQEGIPDLDILDSSSLNKRHAYRQRVKQDLRKRFRTEYLGHLRQSSKFDKNQKPLQIGDIVLVSSDNTKRIEWPLAKVMELYPSKDGSIRLVKECSSETIPDEPDVQRTVNDFSSETVPEKRSQYGRLTKQIVRI
ncbi:integrase catalytic domain-containing protein [Trichonephila inaurata madagascariensis]|uniref:Integrase catalytic domain-containing protein n=1 Tax=Trichonephila inaurata madagascariensis TaxID=2747483 RepID=A0A8X6WQ41_9ARAC|nr:integrase catalytic domain-containing protein [Trichonephila inaurata madagascariensis]